MMATTNSDSDSSQKNTGNDENNSNGMQNNSNNFECNICLENATDAVVTVCGHLFCWPCLYQWFNTRLMERLCPVCKADISEEKIIPIYGHGYTVHKELSSNIPPRPAGKRTEHNDDINHADEEFDLTFGDEDFEGESFFFGLLTPFSFFNNPDEVDEEFQHADNYLSNLFSYILVIFILGLIYA